MIDPDKAEEDSRSSGLQKEAVQKEELPPQEPQWRYQLPILGSGQEVGGRLELWGCLGCPRMRCLNVFLHPQPA